MTQASRLGNASKIGPFFLKYTVPISQKTCRATITVSIFNPGTGIFTIYHTFTKKNGLSYLPCYYVLVRNPGDTRLYFGALAEKGPALTFSQLMKKYYHGSLAALLETMTWGGRDKRDSYLVEELGAQYQSYRFDILHGTATAFFTLQDAKWRPCGPVALPVLFQIYAEKNQSLVREILETIKPHDRGTFFRMPSCKPIKTFDNRPEMDYCQDSSLEIHSALNTGSLCRAGQLTGGTISCRLQLT
ncbi:hypothetical protein [Evtepia gabavorous]|uniref:hypothetical protein n=1 Tax=Evtepia gabavorous TaxID=2211183 RepID=UPI003A92C2B2